ncbi:ATP-binding cassette domain-containing protein [Aggregatilineales bacterium SYSU G02658]
MYETTPLLEVRNLRKSFGGVQAAKDVSFSLNHGEIVAIVGDNGAGKSTVIKMIAAAYKRDAGEIFWQGRPVDLHSPDEARRLGIETMYQELALVGDLDPAANVFLGQEPMRWLFGFIPILDRRKMKQETKRLLSRVKINLPDLDSPVRQLSGGQRQATAIARFLLNDTAKLIIMDEPTAALGVQETQKVIELIRQLKLEDITVLVISHNLEHVFTLADRIIVLRSGRVAGIRETHNTTKQQIVSLIMGAED